jgi:EAL domain-containing protein (putative c-di-GMP-specific phosphodiesterase class I)
LPSLALPSVPRPDVDRRRVLAILELVNPVYAEQLDRWTRVAADALGASAGFVLLLDDPGRSLGCSQGAAAWTADPRRAPLTHSFCQWVVGHGRPVAIDDARRSGPLQRGIDVSAQQLRHPELQTIIADALKATRLSADRLYVEITETALLASDATTEQNVRGLDAMGVHIALDDFGTGYSSLAVLKAYPIKAIKIDRSFIDGLPEDHDNAAIVTALIGMAKSLGLGVVAEGVETARQYAALRDLGCDLAQGYLVGRPVGHP